MSWISCKLHVIRLAALQFSLFYSSMGSRTALVVFSAVLLISSVPVGRCFVTALLDSITKTAAQGRDSLADVGHAGIQSVMTGTKGLHRMVKFASDTVSDYHANTMGSLVNGHKKAGELLDDGVESLVDLGSRIGVKVKNTYVTGTKRAAKHSVDFAKSGVDILNRAASGTTTTLRTAVQEGHKAVKSLPKVPILTALLELPYKVADSTLGALTDMQDDAADRAKSMLDKVRPEEDDDDADDADGRDLDDADDNYRRK